MKYQIFKNLVKLNLLFNNFSKSEQKTIQRIDSIIDEIKFTERQSEIMGLIAQGLSEREIGKQLGLCQQSINQCFDTVCKKINRNMEDK